MDERETPDLEVDVGAIVAVLERHGADEGQPEQAAGRWVEAGFEDPGEIDRLLEAGRRAGGADGKRTVGGRLLTPLLNHWQTLRAMKTRTFARGTVVVLV